jgi:hypothetical protein
MKKIKLWIAATAAVAGLALGAGGCGPSTAGEACQGHGGVSWSQMNPNIAFCHDGSRQTYY